MQTTKILSFLKLIRVLLVFLPLPTYAQMTNYINLFDVQKYLTAMAAGACQKNIAQPTIKNLPIPEILLTSKVDFEGYFNEYENKSLELLKNIDNLENQLSELKSDISSSIKNKINEHYK